MTDRWQQYFAAAGDEPRITLLDALARHEAEGRDPGLAVDLGAGTGRDTSELVRRGWRVVAVDAHADAVARLRALDGPIEVVHGAYASADWPAADLINASFALPFAAPQEFDRVWARVRATLQPGGRFCGQLFGPRDEWAPAEDMTFNSRPEIERLVDGWELERLDEIDEDGETATGRRKHWHLFHVVARRP